MATRTAVCCVTLFEYEHRTVQLYHSESDVLLVQGRGCHQYAVAFSFSVLVNKLNKGSFGGYARITNILNKLNKGMSG